jgi:predicted ATP-dependent endonuclease of OLD family
MRVRKIIIRNFKKFANLETGLTSFDCLVGGNNSGKSTLLQSLALFDFVLHNCLTRKTGNGNEETTNKGLIEIKNRSIAPEEFIVLPVANAIDLWTDKTAQKGGNTLLLKLK